MSGATKSNVAYDRARRDIVTGVIPANEPIDESALGARYGLGRTPIREALKQLRNDQLIVWPDRRSPYVPEIGVAHVKSLYEARTIFETQIAVLDKASALGEHNLSGAVVNPRAFRELFPELRDADFPFRAPVGKEQVLPVDWTGITRHGKSETNYQLLPGDRLYVRPKK